MAGGIPLSSNQNLVNIVRGVQIANQYTGYLNQEAYPITTFYEDHPAPYGFRFNTSSRLITKSVQGASHAGQMVAEDQFEPVSFSRGPALLSMSWRRARVVFKGLQLDKEETDIASNTDEQIADYVMQQVTAQNKAIVDSHEFAWLFGPQSLAELNANAFEGLLPQACVTMNQTTGAYQANPTGGFTGMRSRLLSGEVPTLKNGLDPTLPENVVDRNYNITTEKQGIDQDVAQLIRRVRIKTGFTAGRMHTANSEDSALKGGKRDIGSIGPSKHVVMMGTTDWESYHNLLSLWRDNAGTDALVSMEGNKISGYSYIHVPGLENDFARRIVLVNRENVGMYKSKKFWNYEIPLTSPENADMVLQGGRRFIGQTICDDPRSGIATISRPY